MTAAMLLIPGSAGVLANQCDQKKVDMFSRTGGRPTGSKITALVLGWVEDSAFRSDSRGFGVAGSFSRCAFAWIVW